MRNKEINSIGLWFGPVILLRHKVNRLRYDGYRKAMQKYYHIFYSGLQVIRVAARIRSGLSTRLTAHMMRMIHISGRDVQ